MMKIQFDSLNPFFIPMRGAIQHHGTKIAVALAAIAAFAAVYILCFKKIISATLITPFAFSKKEILTQDNVQLLDEFRTRGINFHFATGVKLEIYKHVLFDLPKGDYIVLYVPTPRIIEYAKNEECQQLLTSLPNPVVLAFNWAVRHNCSDGNFVEFRDKHDLPLQKNIYVIPLLCSKEISVQKFNQEKIKEFKNKINKK